MWEQAGASGSSSEAVDHCKAVGGAKAVGQITGLRMQVFERDIVVALVCSVAPSLQKCTAWSAGLAMRDPEGVQSTPLS